MDIDTCYAAIKSRDDRFDGKFLMGVVTTGIYCRPICPARTPLKENIRIFRHASEAAEASFRPCLRCRPELAAESQNFLGVSKSVVRALKKIEEGFLDKYTIADLASEMGVSERQLRRCFLTHLGTTPSTIATTRRLLTAKKLLNESNIPMSKVAYNAGYKSIRQFNHAIKKNYGRRPSDLRKRKESDMDNTEIILKTPFFPEYDWQYILDYFRNRCVPFFETVTNDSYKRLIKIDDKVGFIELKQCDHKNLQVHIDPSLIDCVSQILTRVRGMFDLTCDPEHFQEIFQKDKVIMDLFRKNKGIRVPGCWDFYELGIRTIINQQISIKAAVTVLDRIVRKYGLTHREDSTLKLFPDAEVLRDANLDNLGLTSAKIDSIKNFSIFVLNGGLENLKNSDSYDESVAILTAIKGIGPWTANYLLMRGLRENDAFLYGDVVFNKKIEQFYDIDSKDKKKVTEIAEQWRPWRSYATHLLWNAD